MVLAIFVVILFYLLLNDVAAVVTLLRTAGQADPAIADAAMGAVANLATSFAYISTQLVEAGACEG